MKKFFKKTLCIFLCAVLILTLFYGCSKEPKKINFIYPFSGNVNSYDPQVAETSDEFLIIENTFEGLVRISDDGKVVSAAAEKWDVSKDGLSYTFYLKKGLKWNIDTETDENGKREEDDRLEYMGYDFNPDITAHDFVFGLRRAVQPETDCPLYSSFSCIKNAGEIHSGKMKSNQLGVTAVDDYTLQITLSSADDAFMYSLTSAAAMPCNEEFFNATKGRYGLGTEYTLFNGQFYVDQILESSYLLKNNKQYTGPSPAAGNELTLKIPDEESDNTSIIEGLESGYYDAAFISGTDSEKIKKNSGITYNPYCDTTWTFLLNTNDEVLQYKKLRQAICLGFTHLNDTGKEYLKDAVNLVPPSCTVSSNNAVEALGASTYKQDIKKSKELWKKGCINLDSKQVTLTVITTDEMQNYVKQIIQGIQSGIGSLTRDDYSNTISFTLKVQAMSKKEMETALKKGEYDIAFYPYESANTSASGFLKNISDDNYTDFDAKTFNKSMEKTDNASNIQEMTKAVKSSEQALVDTYSIYPMLYESSYYACAKGVKNIQFHPGTGRVSFVNATREE